MTPATESYILQQAEHRASILVKWGGFSPQDWADVRQDLALDCLRRIPRFDPTRGEWHAYVRGVIYNQSTLLFSRRRRHLRREILADDLVVRDRRTRKHLEHFMEGLVWRDSLAAPRNLAELRIDISRVLASVSRFDRSVAEFLVGHSAIETGQRLGVSRASVYRAIGRLRVAFSVAGFASCRARPPAACYSNRDSRIEVRRQEAWA
jgi:RNA polymerase sigma-70 factor (ECF subfamily)